MLVIFAICLLLTVIAVTDLSAAYLRRQGAMSLADGAALAATEAAAAGSVYQGGGGRFVPINQTAAAAAVRRYLTTTGAYGDYPGCGHRCGWSGTGCSSSLTMPYRLPIPSPASSRPPWCTPPAPPSSPSTNEHGSVSRSGVAVPVPTRHPTAGAPNAEDVGGEWVTTPSQMGSAGSREDVPPARDTTTIQQPTAPGDTMRRNLPHDRAG